MASNQPTLIPDEHQPPFDPTKHGLWDRYVTAGQDGEAWIDHAAWMRACATGEFVGTCRQCGDYLVPVRPEDVTATRTDYEARCRRPVEVVTRDGVRTVEGCGAVMTAARGLVFRRSSRTHERPGPRPDSTKTSSRRA